MFVSFSKHLFSDKCLALVILVTCNLQFHLQDTYHHYADQNRCKITKCRLFYLYGAIVIMDLVGQYQYKL